MMSVQRQVNTNRLLCDMLAREGNWLRIDRGIESNADILVKLWLYDYREHVKTTTRTGLQQTTPSPSELTCVIIMFTPLPSTVPHSKQLTHAHAVKYYGNYTEHSLIILPNIAFRTTNERKPSFKNVSSKNTEERTKKLDYMYVLNDMSTQVGYFALH